MSFEIFIIKLLSQNKITMKITLIFKYRAVLKPIPRRDWKNLKKKQSREKYQILFRLLVNQRKQYQNKFKMQTCLNKRWIESTYTFINAFFTIKYQLNQNFYVMIWNLMVFQLLGRTALYMYINDRQSKGNSNS